MRAQVIRRNALGGPAAPMATCLRRPGARNRGSVRCRENKLTLNFVESYAVRLRDYAFGFASESPAHTPLKEGSRFRFVSRSSGK